MALRAAPYVGNAAVVKLTSAGDFAWVQTIDNANPNCRTELWALTVGTDGTVWGAGWAASGAACQELGGGGPGSEPLIVAYSAAGEARGAWALPPTTQAPAYAFGVAPGPSGSVYVGGMASGLIDLDPGPGVGMRWAGSSQTGGFLVKLAADASLLWAEGLPGISANSLAATGDGGVLLGGYGPNAVVARVGPNGTPDWTFATGGPTGSKQTRWPRGAAASWWLGPARGAETSIRDQARKTSPATSGFSLASTSDGLTGQRSGGHVGDTTRTRSPRFAEVSAPSTIVTARM